MVSIKVTDNGAVGFAILQQTVSTPKF